MSVLTLPRQTAFEDPTEESFLLVGTVIAEAVTSEHSAHSTIRGLVEAGTGRVFVSYRRTPPASAEDSEHWALLLDSLAKSMTSVAPALTGASKKWTTTTHRKALPPAWRPLVVSASTRKEIVAVFRLFGLNDIAERLSYLRSLADDDPDETPMDVESLRAMALFLMSERQLPNPQIGITPDGLMQIEWRIPPSGIVAMEFRRSDMIRFAAISPSKEPGGDRRRINGTLRTHEALAAVLPFTSLPST